MAQMKDTGMGGNVTVRPIATPVATPTQTSTVAPKTTATGSQSATMSGYSQGAPTVKPVTPVNDAKAGNVATPIVIKEVKPVVVKQPTGGTGTTVNKQTTTSTVAPKAPSTPTTATKTATTTDQQKFDTEQANLAKQATDALNAPNKYMDTLETMKFEYDPQSDAEYQRDAAGLENQVAQMMVGRGGLYSSVASSALQSGLINLQLNKTAQKYEEFKAERDFTFQMAQAERQANTDNFNKIMAIKGSQLDEYKFKAQQKQQELENQYKALEFKMRQEEIAYNRKIQEQNLQIQREKARVENETQKAVINLTKDYQVWNKQKTDYDKYITQWTTSGTASKDVANFFTSVGITVPQGAPIAYYGKNLASYVANLGAYQNDLTERAFALNRFDEFNKMIDSTNAKTGVNMTRTEGVNAEGQPYSSSTYKYGN